MSAIIGSVGIGCLSEGEYCIIYLDRFIDYKFAQIK